MKSKTYLKNPPDPNPRYYEGLSHQGAQRHPYPYRMDDNLTDAATTRTYATYRLENAYIMINVIPELGGRIYSGHLRLWRMVVLQENAMRPSGAPRQLVLPRSRRTVWRSRGMDLIWNPLGGIIHELL